MTTSLHLPTESNTDRIDKALSIAVAYGGVDGALTGCPVNADGPETYSWDTGIAP